MSVTGLIEVGIASTTALIITFGSIRYHSLKHKHTWIPLSKDSDENPIKIPALRCSSCGEIKEIPTNEPPPKQEHIHKWKVIDEKNLVAVEDNNRIKGMIKIQECSGCGELREVRFNA